MGDIGYFDLQGVEKKFLTKGILVAKI